jgi:hypothetical protein
MQVIYHIGHKILFDGYLTDSKILCDGYVIDWICKKQNY